MNRDFERVLTAWKARPGRKPLLLKGARQTGKTFLLRRFGTTAYASVCELNFEAQPALARVFEGDLDPKRLMADLALVARFDPADVLAGRALLLFDEVQACPRAITSLKYFCEQAPQVHVAAAGSLLGVELAKAASFPAGKVELHTLHPLTIHEFLDGTGRSGFRERLDAIDEVAPLPEALHAELTAALREYLFVGGMPEAVKAFAERRDFAAVRRIQGDIVAAYRLDFAKHAPSSLVPRLVMLWDSIPQQLARENRRFLFSAVRGGARARDYEDALLWLEQAGLVHRSFAVSVPKLPLAGYCNRRLFKLFALDVGLLAAAANLAPETILHGNDVFEEFKGAITEQFVAQQLASRTTGEQDGRLYYWRNESTGTEIDFLVEAGGVVPLEVKAGVNARSKSLAHYRRQFDPHAAVRASLRNLRLDDGLLNIPLYAVPCLDRLLRLRDIP